MDVEKAPVKQPASSGSAAAGLRVASCGMYCSAPIATCAAANADGPVTSTASAHQGTARFTTCAGRAATAVNDRRCCGRWQRPLWWCCCD